MPGGREGGVKCMANQNTYISAKYSTILGIHLHHVKSWPFTSFSLSSLHSLNRTLQPPISHRSRLSPHAHHPNTVNMMRHAIHVDTHTYIVLECLKKRFYNTA